MKLSERLEARAAFEDNRVLDEAKAMGFVPDVYTGSQTGALLREAAELARRVEGAEVGRRYAHADDDWIVTPDEDGGVDHPYVRVRIVPEAGQGVAGGR